MKNILFCLLIAVINCSSVEAQVPQSLNYQAGLYDLTGMPLFNVNASLRMSILDTSANGPVVYSESFSTTTDVNGLFNLNLGTGNIITGKFDSIDWSNGKKWLKTEIDTGAGYIIMGVTKFLSVPYALYAEKSRSSSSFGNWAGGLQTNKVYKASSDGFLNITMPDNSLFVMNCLEANVVSDSSPSPTTQIATWYNGPGTLIVPIKKNDYWIVKSGCLSISSIRWLPLN